MVSPRPVRIISNCYFAVVGCVQHFYPVPFLHAVLSPNRRLRSTAALAYEIGCKNGLRLFLPTVVPLFGFGCPGRRPR
jgi:hypothetical protein